MRTYSLPSAMSNTYLLEVIKALLPAQRHEAAIFLSSPIFNTGNNAKDLEKLYQIILEAAPAFSEDALTKETVYTKVFPGHKIVSGRLEKLMADLNKLLRAFLLTKRYLLESNDLQQQLDWLAWLREQGLVDRSQQLMSKLENQKEADRKESLSEYRTAWLIAEEKHEWESIYNQAKGDLNIPTLMRRLDIFYQNYRVELANRYLLQQKAAHLPDLETVKLGAKQQVYEESILFKISQKVFELLKSGLPSEKEFQDLLGMLSKEEHALSFQALVQYYSYLRNTCTLLINGGHLEFTAVLHKIHKDNLGRGLLFLNGEISPHTYVSLVQIAIRVKDNLWAREFTEAHKKIVIGGDEDQFYYRFNLSHCFFSEGKFEEALDSLPDAPSNTHYHRTIRRLELKIYYEMRSDLATYKLFAFRKFVERTAPKTIAADLLLMDIEFFNVFHQLLQSPLKDKVRSAKLIERIQKKPLLSDRAWLLEKAKELG